jgi:alcohol dehydrogenase (NADP+)
MVSIPPRAFGTWRLSVDVAEDAVVAAARAGYRHFDCAMIYRNEHAVGRGLARIMAPESEGGLGISRDSLWITTKIWPSLTATQESMFAACKRSVSDLGVSSVDLLLLHHACIDTVAESGRDVLPEPSRVTDLSLYDWYPKTVKLQPMHVKWARMEALVDAGLTRNIGVSNCPVAVLADIMSYAKHMPVANQVELHPCLSQPKLVDFCRARRVVVQAYSTLGCGNADFPTRITPSNMWAVAAAGGKEALAGLLAVYGEESAFTGAPATSKLGDSVPVRLIASKHAVSTVYVLYRWALQRGVCVLQRSGDPEHIAANFAVMEGPALDDDDMRLLGLLNSGTRVFDAGSAWGLPYFA